MVEYNQQIGLFGDYLGIISYSYVDRMDILNVWVRDNFDYQFIGHFWEVVFWECFGSDFGSDFGNSHSELKVQRKSHK